MFDIRLSREDHVRRYRITHTGPEGWEVCLEEDSSLRRQDRYQDWHRVERALAQFQKEVDELTDSGWRIS